MLILDFIGGAAEFFSNLIADLLDLFLGLLGI